MVVTTLLSSVRQRIPIVIRRNIGISAPFAQKASDPIQQLFIDKIREYKKKSDAAGGKVVDPTPELDRELHAELMKVAKQYGGGEGVDMTKFPTFSFKDPEVDPIKVVDPVKVQDPVKVKQ